MRLDGKKTILVTGGLGFIGSHFIELALSLGHHVINIDKKTYAAWCNHDFKGEYEYINEDISKIKTIPYCDFIVNFAAESHVDNSIEESRIFLDSNIYGVYNLLEILKNSKISALKSSWEYKYPIFLQISTDEVFGDISSGFFKENDVHKPSNPYSATKSAAEQIVSSWGRTYDIPYIITRTTNNYGKRQYPEKLIPKAITSILKGEKVPIHGDGSYIRNWIHVEDNVWALYSILDGEELNQGYHICSKEEYSVKEIVELICKKIGVDYDSSISLTTDRNGADVRYALDITKPASWSIQHSLADSLDEIIEYYKSII